MFIDCSNLIPRNPARHHTGIAVGDIDGDGRNEVLVGAADGPNRILTWDGQGLADHPAAELLDPKGATMGLACADIDGDGREEVYLANVAPDAATKAGGGPAVDRLFAGFGTRWLDLFCQAEHMAVANRAAAWSVAALDRLGTGRYGFLVANEDAPMRLYELDARGKLVDMAEEAGLDAIAAARSLLALPLTGDAMDVVCGNEAGPNYLYRNLGDGSFEEIAEAWQIADPHWSARGIQPLDIDGDGRFDLVLANWQGPQRLFVQRPGAFREVAGAEFSLPGRLQNVIVADFDNDGYEEIFFHCDGEPNRLYGRREDEWVALDPGDALDAGGPAMGAAVADLDGDGQLELILSHGPGGARGLSLFIAEPRGNGWLRVRPLTRAGAPARGAVVRLTAGGRTQLRAICAGSGHLCQMEPVAHFGLGKVAAVEMVEVRWPDGAVVEIEAPTACQTIVVKHPEG